MEREATFDIICCKINDLYQLIPGRGFTGGSRVKNIRLAEGSSFDREYLYILSYEDFMKHKKQLGRCAAILTGCPKEVPAQGNIAAAADSSVAPSSLFQAAATVFADFYEWRETLHDFSHSSQSLSQLMKNAAVFMEMELSITDLQYHTHFTTRPEDDGMTVMTDQGQAATQEMKNLLNTQPEFADSFHTRGVQPYPNPYAGLMYYYNIFYEGSYLARIVATFPEQPFHQGRVRLLDYLAPFMEQTYIRYYQNRNPVPGNARLLALLKTLVSGQSLPDSLTLQDILRGTGWEPGHTYQVIQLELEEYSGNAISRSYFCAQFDQTFPACATLQLPDRILSVRNLSADPSDLDFHRNFPCFLRENLCRAGVSNQAAGIRRLSQLAMEANDALLLGRKKNSTFWYWHFSNYTLDYLKAHCVRQYPADQLEHPALALLRSYDSRNNGSLYPTLEMYVRQRFSASAAAAALFIHRSTFLHRLDRIQSLAKLDFTDEQLRLWLTLSFFLAEQTGGG